MGDQYRSELEKLSVEQRKKFLEDDWSSHFMLLELYDKLSSPDSDFDAFCEKFCKSLVSQAQADHVTKEEPYSWNKYIQEQLNTLSNTFDEFDKEGQSQPSQERSSNLENFTGANENKEPGSPNANC